MLAHLAGDMGDDDMAVVQLYAKSGIGQGFNHFAFHFDLIFFRHKTPNAGKSSTPLQTRGDTILNVNISVVNLLAFFKRHPLTAYHRLQWAILAFVAHLAASTDPKAQI